MIDKVGLNAFKPSICLRNKLFFLSLQTNEVNQGDALEHNFNAVYSALLLPVALILPVQEFPQVTVGTSC